MTLGASIFGGARPPAPPAAGGQPFQAPQAQQQVISGAPTPSGETEEQRHARLAARAFGGGKVEAAKAGFDRGANDAPGHYVSRIDKMVLHESTNPDEQGDLMVIVEKTVVFVLEPGAAGQTSNRVGERVGQVFKLRKQQSFGSFKLMVAKILDIPIEEVNYESCFQVTAPSNPLGGTVVIHRNAYSPKPMKGKKEHFLNVNYERAVPATELLADFSGSGIPADTPKETRDIQLAELKRLKDKFFPNGILERMAEAEKAAGQAG